MVGDHIPRKWIIVSGLYTWSIFTGLTTLCSSLWGFIFVRGAEGLGETFYFPASTSLMSDYHSKKTRSRALGFHHTGTYVGTIVGGVLTGWLAQTYGWRTPFLILGVLGIIFGFVLVVFLREPKRDEAESVGRETPHIPLKKFLPELIRNKSALALVAVFFLANFVTLPFYAWLPTFVSEKFNLSIAQAAFAGTFYLQGSSSIGAFLGGFVADSWRKKSLGGRIFTQAVGIVGYAPFMFLLGWTPNYLTCVLAMCALGLFKGFYDANVWAAFYDVVPLSRRGTTCGFANTLAWAGGSMSVFLVGFIVDKKILTMGETLRSFPILNIAMGLLLLFAGRKLIKTGGEWK
jgi:MFS family permease